MPHTLVTGANGFVAAHIIEQLMDEGHTVTGSIRRAVSGDELLGEHPEWKGKLDFVLIEDYAEAGAWDDVFSHRQIDYIVHVAAPLNNPADTDYNRDYFRPNVEGITPDQAREMQNAYISYCSSKKEAELAIWKFVKEENPDFAVTVLLPALIFGPPIHPVKSLKSLNYSTGVFYSLWNDTYPAVPATTFPSYIDVRDLATAHVRALTIPEAANKRFLIGGKDMTYSAIVDTLRKLSENGIPALNGRLPEPSDEASNVTFARMETEEGNKVLGLDGKLRSMEETFGDAARRILELEKKLSS
ncbi:NAD(P)-binding protein [Rhizodiscina lignyota]|uniref:NAD(P)-binding protein n=1 Tax=Rhizodiscina lignyota TaxID=1504668 RepID=A0A9P4IAF1_9PEZI|nr:NAD(P)-binding protein [Rhizodiscina lignyota]